MNSPLFPKGGAGTDARRMQEAAQELSERVINSGQFLQRLNVNGLLRSQATGVPQTAVFGAINRVEGKQNILLQLPPISGKTIGVPLYLTKPSAVGTVTVVTSGLATDRSVPSIDGQFSRQIIIPGLTGFINDGLNWYSLGGDARLVFDVTLFGAIPGSLGRAVATVNTAAFQRAMDEANRIYLATGVAQTVRIPGARFALMLDSASWWTLPLNGSTTEFHGAVALRSGVTVEFSPGAEIVGIAPTGASSSWYYGLFASAGLYTTIGTLERVKFLRPRFEFGVGWDQSLISLFGIVAVGVRGLAIEQGEASNVVGLGAGRFARLMNCEDWRVPDLSSKDVVQVLYLSYLRSGSFSGVVDGFREAFDIDQSCWDIRGDVDCRNGSGEGQCLDISSVQDGYFKLTCYDVGNAAIVYPKPECWEQFSDWVTNFPKGATGWSPNPVMVKRVTLDVSGENIHHPTEIRTVQVGLDRADSAFSGYWGAREPMVQDLTLRLKAKNSAPVLVYEGSGLDLNLSIDGALTATGTRVNDAAVILRQARTGATGIANSELSGKAVVRVKDSNGGGVRVSCPTDFDLEATVDGYNLNGFADQQFGVRFEDLDRKNGALSFGNIRSGGGTTGIDPTDLFAGWAVGASGYVRVTDRGGHRLTSGGTRPVRFPNVRAGYVLGGKDIAIPTLSTLTGAYQQALSFVPEGAKLTTASVYNRSAITGSASGFCAFSIQRIRAGTAATIGTPVNYDSAAIAAGTIVEIPVDGDDVDGNAVAGDAYQLNVTREGAGSVLSDLVVKVTITEHSR